MTPERNRFSRPPGDDEPDTDLLLLSKISNEIVRLQKQYFGGAPRQAKSYLLDDFLLVVMRGGGNAAESTMLEFDRSDLVGDFRREFENELAAHLVAIVQALTRRTIVSYQAQILLDPHIVVQIFFFSPEEAGRAPEGGGAPQP